MGAPFCCLSYVELHPQESQAAMAQHQGRRRCRMCGAAAAAKGTSEAAGGAQMKDLKPRLQRVAPELGLACRGWLCDVSFL